MNTIDKTLVLQLQYHLVYCWRRRSKEVLQISFSRGSSIYYRVIVNVCQILALFFGEPVSHLHFHLLTEPFKYATCSINFLIRDFSLNFVVNMLNKRANCPM